MLLFGHLGITLGASALLTNALSKNRFSGAIRNDSAESSSHSPQRDSSGNGYPRNKASWFAALGTRLDIRLVLMGSMLPDIIDKPIGVFFFRDELSNGRIFSHTLLFLILITIAGYFLYRNRGTTHLLAISLGTFAHLILDQMWRTPEVLFWPAYGFAFDKLDVSDWIHNLFHALFTNPEVYIPELVGLLILVWFAVILVRQRTVLRFLKSGQVQ